MTTAVDKELRQRGAERFATLGWPTPRLEEWKYTNLSRIASVDWRPDENPAATGDVPPLSGRAAVELTFVNGHLVSRRGEAKGVTVTPIAESRSEHLGRLAGMNDNAMVALNAANMQDGALVEVAPGTVVEGFIHLIFTGRGDRIWSHPRVVIVAGANSQAAIVETYAGSGRYFTNAVTEAVAGEGAVLDHYRIQCESRDAFHIGTLQMRGERSSSMTSRNISLGSALARTDIGAVLAGEGASLVLDGLFVGNGTQHLDNHTVIDHAVPHCDSSELYKGILDDDARGVFDGRIIVRPDAKKTASRQVNKNLLLSETAIVDSKPTLEIHNDDVKCNHGSTIGQLDEEAMFYLRSRGVSQADARTLLVFAFAGEIVDRMTIEPVREQVRRALFEQMPERLPERRAGARK